MCAFVALVQTGEGEGQGARLGLFEMACNFKVTAGWVAVGMHIRIFGAKGRGGGRHAGCIVQCSESLRMTNMPLSSSSSSLGANSGPRRPAMSGCEWRCEADRGSKYLTCIVSRRIKTYQEAVCLLVCLLLLWQGLSAFPFGRVRCQLELGSWSYGPWYVNVSMQGKVSLLGGVGVGSGKGVLGGGQQGHRECVACPHLLLKLQMLQMLHMLQHMLRAVCVANAATRPSHALGLSHQGNPNSIP